MEINHLNAGNVLETPVSIKIISYYQRGKADLSFQLIHHVWGDFPGKGGVS